MPELEPLSNNCYRIARQGNMNAHVHVYLSRVLYEELSEEKSLEQLIDAASLPGVVSPVVGMPDIHTGFGLPIGGVMAMDAEEGLVSAGAVGMDINCGVRLLKTNLDSRDFDKPLLRRIIKAITARVPSGIGHKSIHHKEVKANFGSLIEKGVPHLIQMGYGRQEDLDAIEDRGVMADADQRAVSKAATDRGLQLSTIGGGNHFIELGRVEEIFDVDYAASLGLNEKTVTVLIHTGSRGFGHQICTDFMAEMKGMAGKYGIKLPSAGLAAVPIKSPEGKRYLRAMACAVNFAYCNRQWVTDDVRKAFVSALGGKENDYDLGLVYDVAHNTARFEKIGGRKLLIHRKGAVRALPPRHPDTPAKFREMGHPVLIPGSMGSSSYIIVAEPEVENVFNSVNHGAGRVLSRTAAKKTVSVEQLKNRLGEVMVSGRNYKAYLDEAPQAYKNIDAVIETFTEIGFCRKIARLTPLAVIKGEGGD